MNIRPLTGIPEFQDCLELQRSCFGWDDLDVMPVRLFVVTQHTGGLVLGAFEKDRLVGFLSALPAIREGKPYWHSHMLAVRDSCRNRGIGTDLKLSQRDHARRRGIRRIEWTFDPLESKNAYVNLEKLGVIVRRYHPNFYGETTAAAQRGLPSDRLIAEWRLDEARVSLSGELRRVSIPSDIGAIKQADLQAARDIQLRVRQEFLTNLADGFAAVALERHRDSSDYVFVRGLDDGHPEH